MRMVERSGWDLYAVVKLRGARASRHSAPAGRPPELQPGSSDAAPPGSPTRRTAVPVVLLEAQRRRSRARTWVPKTLPARCTHTPWEVASGRSTSSTPSGGRRCRHAARSRPGSPNTAWTQTARGEEDSADSWETDNGKATKME